jgi:hypothetical protein
VVRTNILVHDGNLKVEHCPEHDYGIAVQSQSAGNAMDKQYFPLRLARGDGCLRGGRQRGATRSIWDVCTTTACSVTNTYERVSQLRRMMYLMYLPFCPHLPFCAKDDRPVIIVSVSKHIRQSQTVELTES